VSDAATTLARAPVDETGLIEEARERRGRGMSRRELVFAIGWAGSFAIAAIGLALGTTSDRHPSLAVVLALMGMWALVWNVEFETKSGSIVPTFLVLVPMCFLVPLGWIPVLIAVSGSIPELRTRENIGRRVLGGVGSSWPILGPVAVMVIAGEPQPTWNRWPLVVLGLLAAAVVDLASTWAHQWVIVGKRRPPFATTATGLLFEAVFASSAFIATLATPDYEFAFLVPLSLLLLARQMTQERSSHVDKAVELSHAYRGTALLLGTVIDADDGYTGFHSRGVVDLALLVARELRLDDPDLRRTEFAALLHDVGKIRIPKEIINKAGPLTPEEWVIIRRHPGEGAEMLEHVGGFLSEIGEIVRHHHEKWDGSGYPDGIAGEAIPLIARIVAVCDAFSAITTDRAYRKGRSVEFALGELRDYAGTQFDPRVVRALCSVMAREDGITPAPVENVA
jgi:putative nucleotidyltransferase with HDIG domain